MSASTVESLKPISSRGGNEDDKRPASASDGKADKVGDVEVPTERPNSQKKKKKPSRRNCRLAGTKRLSTKTESKHKAVKEVDSSNSALKDNDDHNNDAPLSQKLAFAIARLGVAAADHQVLEANPGQASARERAERVWTQTSALIAVYDVLKSECSPSSGSSAHYPVLLQRAINRLLGPTGLGALKVTLNDSQNGCIIAAAGPYLHWLKRPVSAKETIACILNANVSAGKFNQAAALASAAYLVAAQKEAGILGSKQGRCPLMVPIKVADPAFPAASLLAAVDRVEAALRLVSRLTGLLHTIVMATVYGE